MRYILMSFPVAVEKGIVIQDTGRIHNDNIVILEEQDLVSSGYDLSSLPENFNSEILSAKEMRLKIVDLGL